MLDDVALRNAVSLHRQSYGLLRWVSTSIQKGTITFDRAHRYADATESARDWLRSYADQIPARWRPEVDDPGKLEAFVHMFASYLLTSFDLVEQPGTWSVSDCGCGCPLCTYLVAAPHLRTKKVRDGDKKRARLLKQAYLWELARKLGHDLSESAATHLIDDLATAEAVAMATYGQELIKRCRGHVEGVAILALWREFAWLRSGSPKKDYELTADTILDSERRLGKQLAGG